MKLKVDTKLELEYYEKDVTVQVNYNDSEEEELIVHPKIAEEEKPYLRYRWEVQMAGDSEENRQDCNNATDRITVSNCTHSADYYCTISDRFGNYVQACFHVNVKTGLTITAEEDAENFSYYYQYGVRYGEELTLHPTVRVNEGIGIKAYEWDVKEQLVDKTEREREMLVDKENPTVCKLENITQRVNAYLTVTDTCGNVETIQYIIVVETGLSVKAVSPEEIYVLPGQGEGLQLEAEVSCEREYRIEWTYYDNNTHTNVGVKLPGVTTNVCPVGFENGLLKYGQYRCFAYDEYNLCKTITFYVIADDGHALDLPDEIYVSAGSDLRLDFTPSFYEGTPEKYKQLTYQWSQGANRGDTNEVVFENITENLILFMDITNDYGLRIYKRIDIIATDEMRVCNLQAAAKTETGDIPVYQQSVKKGEQKNLSMRVTAGEGEEIQFSWTGTEDEPKNETQVAVNGVAESSLAVTADAKKRYVCEAKASDGKTVKAYFDILIDNGFAVEPYSHTYEERAKNYGGDTKGFFVKEGDTVRVTTPKVKGVSAEHLSFVWTDLQTGKAVEDAEVTAGEDGKTVSGFDVKAVRNTSYSCLISDDEGNEKLVTVHIIIKNNLSFIWDVKYEFRVTEEEPVAEIVVHVQSDNPNLTYRWQWYEGEEVREIVGKENFKDKYVELAETSNTCKATKAGYYFVTVSDPYGNQVETDFKVLSYQYDDTIVGKQVNAKISNFLKYVCFELVALEDGFWRIPSRMGTSYETEIGLYETDLETMVSGTFEKVPESENPYVNIYSVKKGKHYVLAVSGYGPERVLKFDIEDAAFEVVSHKQAGSENDADKKPADTEEQKPAPVTQMPPTTDKKPASKYVTRKKAVKAADGNYVTTTAKGEAMLVAVKKSSAKKMTIKSTVKVDGVAYTLVGIEKSAFKNAKKLTTLTLPKTIRTIKANAFKSSKIKTVKLSVAKGKTLSVNKKAFKGSKVKTVQVTMKGSSSKARKAMKKTLKNALVKTIKIKK